MSSSVYAAASGGSRHTRRKSRTSSSPHLDTTITVAPSPLLSSSSRVGEDRPTTFSPHPDRSPRLTSAGIRLAVRSANAESPRLSYESSTPRRRRAHSRAARVSSDRRVLWSEVFRHYAWSPKGWLLAAVAVLLLWAGRQEYTAAGRRGRWASPHPEMLAADGLPATSEQTDMLRFIRQQAAAVRKKLPAVLPEARLEGVLPFIFGPDRATDRKRPAKASSSHTYHPNGLLFVNPEGRHPIHSLMERAEREWRQKLHRQSRTLSEAVKTYHRRYRRNPPAGFDTWWRWTQEHNVVLVDEYDQIGRDIAPFHALEPNDLRHRNHAMQQRGHTFIIAIDLRTGEVSAHGEWARIERATDVKNMMERFAKDLPGVGTPERREGKGMDWLNLTIIVDDQPAVLMSYEHRARMRELAEQGEYFSISEWVETSDPTLSNYARACPPDSPLRKFELNHTIPEAGPFLGLRSFIYNHAAAMDLCKHPEMKRLHGFTSGVGVGLGPLVPLFTFAKMPLHTDFLITPLEQYADSYIGNDVVWRDKQKAKLLWRGSTTGAEFRVGYPWRDSQRARLHYQSHSNEGHKTVLLSELGRATEFNATMAELNSFYMDTSFAGTPLQCDDETCEVMRDEIQFAPTQGLDDSYQYKYLIDVDGNGWSGRFHRLMSTRSMVLKSSVFPEWYMDRIQPWLHYVPIKVDYSDLYDVMAFFTGSPDGRGAHDALGERIASAGKQWAAEHWRREDMASYMFRLCIEYLRLLDRDLGVQTDFDPDRVSGR